MAVNLINYYNQFTSGDITGLYSQPGGPTIPNPNDPNNNGPSKYSSPNGTIANNPAPLLTVPVTPNQFDQAGIGLLSELSTGGFSNLLNGADGGFLNDLLPGTDKIAAGIKDSLRMAKWMASPQGIAFNLQQTGLQLMNSFIPHSDPYGLGVNNASLGMSFTPNDTRIYNFGINLLTQIPLEAVDIHVERHGIFPSFLEYPNNQGVYSEYYKDNQSVFKSSLLNLHKKVTEPIANPGNIVRNLEDVPFSYLLKGDELYGYTGGPKSIFGIGRTTHRRWDDTFNDIERIGGVQPSTEPTENTNSVLPIISTTDNIGLPKTISKLKELGIALPFSLGDVSSKTKNERKNLATKTPKTRDTLNLLSLLKGKSSTKGTIENDLSDIFGSNNKPESLPKDLIKFRFEAIDNNSPDNSIYIFFRAFLNGIADRYNPNWSENQYVGRGEKFFTYGGMDRDISFNFTIAAQSRDEMKSLFQKLNFLSSNTAPDYNGAGRMRAPFMKLTIGDYISSVPGFISSLNYSIKDDSPWDIALYKPFKDNFSQDERELPHIIEVSVGYKIIHDFLPKKGTNDVFFNLPNKDPWITSLPNMNADWIDKLDEEEPVELEIEEIDIPSENFDNIA